MKFSYNWLKELVDGLETAPSELCKLITMKTAESEGVDEYAPYLAQVRAARVLSAEPIEGSKNRKAVVDAGPLGKHTVVCGAPNCREGMVTAYAPSGTKLGGKEIRKATIAGIESNGMLASGEELGVNRDHEGILELDLQPGDPLPFLPDHIIEIDNKSLTHRPDLWGHHGMAREVAAITRRKLIDPVDLSLLPREDSGLKVSIADFLLCPRYSALVFENATVGPSPLWLQYKLEAIGLNPINNIVDVTNYVMAELAQPMHAFDADKLEGDTIHVRPAHTGERLQALNQEVYTLDPSNLVIADSSGAVALAGVIGGADSAISAGTARIVLESANFHAGSIRKTSTRLHLRTDASMRFEKSQDPENTVRGLARAITLFREVCPGIRIVGGVADAYQPLRAVPPVELPLDWLDGKLGRSVASAEVRRILEALEFRVEDPRSRVFLVSVPSWRATKDISVKDDLVEEIGRMIGYASITPVPPLQPVTVPPGNPERDFQNAVRSRLATLGYTEVYNYSFISEGTAKRFGFAPSNHLSVTNPIAEGQDLLRVSLVPAITRNINENSRYFDEFGLFEIGREIHPGPREVTRVAVAAFRKSSGAEGFFELKHVAEALAPGALFRPAEPRVFEHPTRCARLFLGDKQIGSLFELHPSFVESGRGAILDVDLDTLFALQPPPVRYKTLQRFPSSDFDLSVVSEARELVGDLQSALARFATPEVEQIEYVRQYAGPPLPEGKKSVSYRVTVAAPDRTLSSEEVSALRARMIEGMRTLGYDLRV